jgi:DNA-binding response OmpR family regulator
MGEARQAMSIRRRDTAPQAALFPSQAHKPSMAVLFIDPDVASAERLAQTLRGRFAVAVVPSAQAARSAMSIRMPDLIVTELGLPDANGVDLIATIHSAPATRNVLVMVVTHRTSVRDKIAALQAGADDYLVKPVDADQFETHFLLVSRFRKVIQT